MNTYRVALVMIARNETATIVRALSSIRNHVDELVIMDTGSIDATVDLARSAGARVAHFTWQDDFAAARNAALDFADADWNVIVDADEWILGGGPALLALRHTAPKFVGTVRIDSRFDTTAGVATSPSWIPRILPRGVRYAGRVHEQPVHTLPVMPLPVIFDHDGYRAQSLQAKAGRNTQLLERALARAPNDAYLHYQIGKNHDVYERYAEAAWHFAQSRAFDLPGERRGWHHDRVVRELHALKCCARHAQAVKLADAAMPDWPNSPDFYFTLGDLLLDWAAEEPQRSSELVPMIEAAWLRCLEIGEMPDLEGAVAGRGSRLAAHNLMVLYEGCGRTAEAAHYRAHV